MDTTILQVPIEKTFRNNVSRVVEEMGFSSLQDYVRLILKKTLKGEVGVYAGPKPIVLSTKNARRYEKMVDEVLSGKVKVKKYADVDEMLYDLRK